MCTIRTTTTLPCANHNNDMYLSCQRCKFIFTYLSASMFLCFLSLYLSLSVCLSLFVCLFLSISLRMLSQYSYNNFFSTPKIFFTVIRPECYGDYFTLQDTSYASFENGDYYNTGRVSFCLNGQFVPVCMNNLGLKEAEIICSGCE